MLGGLFLCFEGAEKLLHKLTGLMVGAVVVLVLGTVEKMRRQSVC